MADYADMYEQVKNKPCKLGVLNISGLQRTHDAVVDRELEGLKEARTLEEMKDVLLNATNNLKSLDIFDIVEARLGAGTPAAQGNKGSVDTVDISLDVREANLLKLHAGSYVNQSAEGSLEGSLALRNYFGWAEQLEATTEVGNQQSSQYSISYTQPRLLSSFSTGSVKAFQATSNLQRYCSITEIMRGGALTWLSGDGQQQVALEGGWQEMSDRSLLASQLIRKQMGHRLRGSAKYTWSSHFEIQDDEQDASSSSSSNAPNLPIMAGIKSETELGVAPIGGAVGFAKQVLSGMITIPTGMHSDMTFVGKVGLLVPLGPNAGASDTCITDRFFLGGVSSLRGFRHRGVGPSDGRRVRPQDEAASGGPPEAPLRGAPPRKRDALGGDLFCSLLAEYNFDLPHAVLEALGIRGHVFANAGNTILLGDRPSLAAIDEFLGTFRVSAGVGLVMPTILGRFEVNYGRVVAGLHENDEVKHGVQMGFMGNTL